MAKLAVSVSRSIGLAGLKCVSTGAFIMALWSSANYWIMAGVGRMGPEKRPFFPHFGISVFGFAIHKKLIIKCL
jgi:hypothetical protein